MPGKHHSSSAAYLCLLAFSLAALPALPQETATTNAAVQDRPADPKILVQVAIPLNSMTGVGTRAWRLKASFQAFTAATSLFPEENRQGNYEELWAGDEKFKQMYADGQQSQTIYGTPNGQVISGGLRFPLGEVRQLHEFFELATYLWEYAEGRDLEFEPADGSAGESACIRTVSDVSKGSKKASPVYRFCFDSTMRLVRFSMNGNDDFLILFRSPFPFRDRAVPGEVELLRHGIVRIDAYLDSLEVVDAVDEAELQPPADAVPVDSEPDHIGQPGRVNMPAGVAAKMVRQSSPPIYPPEARAAGISGTVVLQGTIGTNGLIHGLVVVSGPPELRQAAVDAVGNWRYKPYVLNGGPAEVETTVNVIFTLGK